MNSKYFTFLSFIPALAYWYLEEHFELKIAVIGGMILSLLEMLLEKIFTKHVHAFTKMNFALIIGLGAIALIAQEGIWFKLQPTLSSVVMFFVFWLKTRKGESYLEEMMRDQNSRVVFPKELLKEMERHLAFFTLGYAVVMCFLALKAPTSWWLFGKTGGLYLAFAIFMILEFILMRKKMVPNFSIVSQCVLATDQNYFQRADWLVLSVNAHYFENQRQNIIVEIVNGKNKETIAIGEEGEHSFPLEWRKKLYRISDKKEVQVISGHLFHSSLKELSERFKVLALNPLSSSEVPFDEERGLQWLKVSLTTLKKAIEKYPSQLQCLLFGGTNPEDQRKMLRVVCFNLDFFLIFHDDGRFQLTVFDDKDGGQGVSQKPALQMLFGRLRPQVLDEFILLFNVIGKAKAFPI